MERVALRALTDPAYRRMLMEDADIAARQESEDGDAVWIASLDEINDPAQLLRELVELQDSTLGVGDPYFRELFIAVIDRARQIVVDR